MTVMVEFKAHMLDRFIGIDEGEVTEYFGCELVRDRKARTGQLIQTRYAERVLRVFNMWMRARTHTHTHTHTSVYTASSASAASSSMCITASSSASITASSSANDSPVGRASDKYRAEVLGLGFSQGLRFKV